MPWRSDGLQVNKGLQDDLHDVLPRLRGISPEPEGEMLHKQQLKILDVGEVMDGERPRRVLRVPDSDALFAEDADEHVPSIVIDYYYQSLSLLIVIIVDHFFKSFLVKLCCFLYNMLFQELFLVCLLFFIYIPLFQFISNNTWFS